MTLERAIVYFSKERVRNFIRQEINQNDLLADAVIFAVEEDGPLNLVSYRPKEALPDFRPAIREDNLAGRASFGAIAGNRGGASKSYQGVAED